jgi:hypothetical protein
VSSPRALLKDPSNEAIVARRRERGEYCGLTREYLSLAVRLGMVQAVLLIAYGWIVGGSGNREYESSEEGDAISEGAARDATGSDGILPTSGVGGMNIFQGVT